MNFIARPPHRRCQPRLQAGKYRHSRPAAHQGIVRQAWADEDLVTMTIEYASKFTNRPRCGTFLRLRSFMKRNTN